jgi:thioredoxin-dependent peroxiredoxin
MKLLEVGQKAPDFVVLDHTGKKVSLSDFAGQNVILWFYPKADTPG